VNNVGFYAAVEADNETLRDGFQSLLQRSAHQWEALSKAEEENAAKFLALEKKVTCFPLVSLSLLSAGRLI
jgi:hypothetical protein